MRLGDALFKMSGVAVGLAALVLGFGGMIALAVMLVAGWAFVVCLIAQAMED